FSYHQFGVVNRVRAVGETAADAVPQLGTERRVSGQFPELRDGEPAGTRTRCGQVGFLVVGVGRSVHQAASHNAARRAATGFTRERVTARSRPHSAAAAWLTWETCAVPVRPQMNHWLPAMSSTTTTGTSRVRVRTQSTG